MFAGQEGFAWVGDTKTAAEDTYGRSKFVGEMSTENVLTTPEAIFARIARQALAD